jgi:hypothetical protein
MYISVTGERWSWSGKLKNFKTGLVQVHRRMVSLLMFSPFVRQSKKSAPDISPDIKKAGAVHRNTTPATMNFGGFGQESTARRF